MVSTDLSGTHTHGHVEVWRRQQSSQRGAETSLRIGGEAPSDLHERHASSCGHLGKERGRTAGKKQQPDPRTVVPWTFSTSPLRLGERRRVSAQDGAPAVSVVSIRAADQRGPSGADGFAPETRNRAGLRAGQRGGGTGPQPPRSQGARRAARSAQV